MTASPAVDAKVSSTRHQRKRTSETVPLGKAKSAQDSGSADSLIQCGSKRKCFGTHRSADIVGYGTVQQTSRSCASDEQASSPGNIETGPWMSGSELPGQMNPDFSFITSIVVSGYAVCQAKVAPLLYSRSYTGWWWR
ncbi:hypothetical protein AVEN_236604-1 [Araneus ventricosus]|uniref:Uncharacterized protein n=1 Tax=Araneus ventricosus TaxID=182803 RepID=A0A4Y2PY97_ARAVE|nr:hypothetical protein AVEN_236604-1 [Araneus ventricosus]